jgi:radical SAM superfamily enzyme YgiQ (UPF0313 family)
LVYPETPETYWSYRHALRFVDKKALMPPLGLSTAAAILGEEFEYRLVDMNVEPLREGDIAWAQFVFVSAMIVQAESLKEVIARCNRAGKPVVAGGPYPTSCYEEIEGVDCFVLGEGECTIPELRRDILAGTLRPVYRATTRPSIEEAPVPRFDLCKLSLYETLPLQFSRGCPFDCEFCDIVSLFGHRVRTKGPDQFLREMDALRETGFYGSVFIVDDNFIGNRRRVKALLRRIADWQEDAGYPFVLSTEASVDLADDPELLGLMEAAGFRMVFVGLETPVQESLKGAGKRQNLRGDMIAKVRKIQRSGIEVTAGFIIGFDSDPPDIAERQIDFIRELGVPTAMVGLLMALPNTRLWDRLTKEGRMLFRSKGNNTHDVELNFVPKLPVRVLTDAYHSVLRSIYEPKHYFERCLKLLRCYPRRPTVRRIRTPLRVVLSQARALFRSLRWQGTSPYALWYWLYLIRAVAVRPRQLVTALTLAVRGHHFITITESMVRPKEGPAPQAQATAVRNAVARQSRGRLVSEI